MKKEKYFERALKWVSANGFSNVKANHDSYPDPSPFRKATDEEPIIPDITGTKQGAKSYIEISTKTESIEPHVSKWKLLSTMAARKGGQLVLLAPKGHKSFTSSIAEKYFIRAKIVSI
ncbi:MAG: hypothetical protein MRZ79_21365 [Bacteroidia bacterium]|nr:hypothetical protein [Bacteroidia bacterium]